MNERILNPLSGEFGATADHLRGELGTAFAARFAETMVRSSADYVTDGTLSDSIAKSDEAMRVTFAQRVGWWLEHRMTPSFSADLWARWIRRYLSDPLESMPLPLSDAEGGAMFPWVISTGEHFLRRSRVLVICPFAVSIRESYSFSTQSYWLVADVRANHLEQGEFVEDAQDLDHLFVACQVKLEVITFPLSNKAEEHVLGANTNNRPIGKALKHN